MIKSYLLKSFRLLICLLLINIAIKAQVSYDASAYYSMRLHNPTYKGNAVQVRRTCDNATMDIGFTCGALNTVSLSKFVIASNPLSAISSTSAAAYSLRKLICTYNGNIINVRRDCDNATKDIGLTATGDLDTTSLQKFVFQSYPLSALSAPAAAAYSLRKLNCVTTNSVAILVRRSSDNTTQAIGFTATGDLNTTALLAFVGAGNGFIQTWYDQSGNNNHATAPANANQPQIVTSGVVNTKNGLPTAVFDGSSSYLTIPYAATMNFATASTCNAVLTRTGAAAGTCDAVFAQQYTGNNISASLSWNSLPSPGTTLAYGYYVQGGSGWQNAELPTDVITNTDNIITGTILSGAANTTTINLFQNGTLATSLSNQSTIGAINTAYGFNIGKRWDLANYAPINLQELIVFTSVLSITDRQFLEFSQSAYYGISGPSSLSAIPPNAQSAYITKWYDQSTNHYDVTQVTNANQPRIMKMGVIDRQNGMPAVAFIASSSTVLSYNAGIMANNMSVSVVAKINNASARNALFDLGATTGSYPDFVIEANTYSTAGNKWGFYTNNNSLDAAAATSTNLTTISAIAVNTFAASAPVIANTSFYVNGTAAALSCRSCVTNTYRSSWPNGLTIGNFNTYPASTDGYIPELIVFQAALSNTDRQYLEWSQAQYYSINGPTLGALPATPASGYITKWYDQSGNGNDAIQATTANQPIIVNAGVISLQSGLPAVSLDGTSSYLQQSSLSISNPYTLNAIATRTANGGGSGGYQRLINISAASDQYGYLGVYQGNYATFSGIGSSWNDIAANTPTTTVALNTQSVLSANIATGATGLVPYLNGTAQNPKVGTAATATGFLIGSPYNASSLDQLWTGNISEFNMFTKALNTTRRTLLETNQAAYYGLTISNNKYTPPAAGIYNLFVNGVGRTSPTDSFADTRKSAGMGFIVGTTATDFLKDNGDYITAGTSCPLADGSFANLPATVVKRWANDWYINKTDVGANSGNLKIYFDFTDYGGATTTPGAAANYVLLYRSTSAGTFSIVPGTTVSTSGSRVFFLLDASNITTNYYYTLGTTNDVTSPLPIELLNFTVIPNENKVNIKWETATETHNAYFTIEKSKDGINFIKVMEITGAGNSTSFKEYAETDYQPYTGTSYYRLKQTDFNGAFKYFNMVPVNFEGKKNIVIYPNPIDNTSKLKIEINGYKNKEVTVLLRDMQQGREFLSTVLLSVDNNQTFIIDKTNSLEPGTYIVTASSNDKIYNYKLIVK